MTMEEIGPQETSRTKRRWFHFWKWSHFQWSLILLALAGGLGIALSEYQAEHATTQGGYDLLKIIGSLCEAALIAAVIGLVVDPYLKKHLIGELGPEYFWVTKARSIPRNIREKVEELASRAEYLRRVTWTVNFSWCDQAHCDMQQHLKVDIHTDANGYSTNPDGYTFKPYLWIEPADEHHESRHMSLEFLIPTLDRQVRVGEGKLHEIVSSDDPVQEWLRVAMEQLNHQAPVVPQNQTFVVRRDSALYPTGNLLPFRIRYITQVHKFVLTGEALERLQITFHHATGQEKVCEERQESIQETAPEITFPGQVTVISWRVLPVLQPVDAARPSGVTSTTPTAPPSGSTEPPP
ncbi:hypothetical protein [Kitasatospora sp. NPDC050543]|uniref:hypothetical protein n=1 Tax=Kitasatospora sp. NPDC050543 TaxID=3364054 RepID=UPI00378C059C